MHLHELIDRLRTTWQFQSDTYPALQGANSKEIDRFKRTHVMLHLQKALGRLAEIEEQVDHGMVAAADRALVVDVLAKFVGGAMQMAAVCGIRPEDLDARIRQLYPLRLATPAQMHDLLMRPADFFALLGFEPVTAGLPVDGRGPRIRVGMKPGTTVMPPAEIEFSVGESRVRARIEPFIEAESPEPYANR
jgi:hypothetical protein